MTATVTTITGPILALDLGKFKSVACALDKNNPAAPRFEALTTDRQHLRRLLAKYRPAVVVIEACLLAGWVHDLCVELGLPCKVANTASEAWKFKHQKRKTDKDDALRLAELEALGTLPTVVLPDSLTRQWRQLIAYRQTLVGRRVAAQNRIRALLVGRGLTAPRGHRAWTATGVQGIAQFAKPLAQCAADELWRGMLELTLTDYRQVRHLLDLAEARLDQLAKASPAVQVLDTMPGLGPRTAEAVAAHLHQPERFTTGKQVSAYGGLVPRQYQSGKTDRRGRITRRGPALLRKLLVECAWAMLRYNAWARDVYRRLTHGGKRTRSRPSSPWPARSWCAAGPCSATASRGGDRRRQQPRPEAHAPTTNNVRQGYGPRPVTR